MKKDFEKMERNARTRLVVECNSLLSEETRPGGSKEWAPLEHQELDVKAESLSEGNEGDYNSKSASEPASSPLNRPVDEQHEIEWNVKAEPVVDEGDDSVLPTEYQPPPVPRQEWIDMKVKTECLYGDSDAWSKYQPSSSENRPLLEAEETEARVESEPLPAGNDNPNSRADGELQSKGILQNSLFEEQEKACSVRAASSSDESDSESVSSTESQPPPSRKRPLDQDVDFSQKKRINVGSRAVNQCPDMITLDSDEDEGMSSGSPFSHSLEGVRTGETEAEAPSPSDRRYEFRERKPVNYKEIKNPFGRKRSSKERSLNVFAVDLRNPKSLAKLAQRPEELEEYIACKVEFLDPDSFKNCQTRIETFFLKCGSQFEKMIVQMPYEIAYHKFLRNILKTTPFLWRIDFRYQNDDDASSFLKLLSSRVPRLTELKLMGASSSVSSLRKNHIDLIKKLRPLKSLELGDALWHDVTQETIEATLNQHKDTLETLIIHGGYRGNDDVEHSVNITFPKMAKLENLLICPEYSFHSEPQNSPSGKAREISLDVTVTEEPFKFSIKFSSQIPTLRRLVVGNLIDINDLYFSQVRDLTEFRCGSFWNLTILFPSESSRKELLESSATEIQFPDCLKDPTFVVRARKHFPNVEKVWLNLPSVPVLRAFFKAFEDSQLTHLFLKTQFDFGNTMESCLLPNLEDVLKKSEETELLLKTLRKYKHYEEYIRYHNVELPVEKDDLMENHSSGIAALKSLKYLHLGHIPRTLLIPVPDEERKWFDHSCQFMNTSFGYLKYPLSYKCHQEIQKLKSKNLVEFTCDDNIAISKESTKKFGQVGFKDISVYNVEESVSLADGHDSEDEDIFEKVPYYGNFRYNYSKTRDDDLGSDDDDIFEQVRRAKRGTSVKVKPSMLSKEFKPKVE